MFLILTTFPSFSNSSMVCCSAWSSSSVSMSAVGNVMTSSTAVQACEVLESKALKKHQLLFLVKKYLTACWMSTKTVRPKDFQSPPWKGKELYSLGFPEQNLTLLN